MKKVGKKKAIENREDAHDLAICESRAKEKSISFETVVKNLKKKEKL
jgi:hypothetical protein